MYEDGSVLTLSKRDGDDCDMQSVVTRDTHDIYKSVSPSLIRPTLAYYLLEVIAGLNFVLGICWIFSAI